ncbi:hypothetical protein HG530_009430 [Fusarium avenaceum]|nr:hypothetical protein HG530_009430 [Fusarium avenaceum]
MADVRDGNRVEAPSGGVFEPVIYARTKTKFIRLRDGCKSLADLLSMLFGIYTGISRSREWSRDVGGALKAQCKERSSAERAATDAWFYRATSGRLIAGGATSIIKVNGLQDSTSLSLFYLHLVKASETQIKMVLGATVQEQTDCV